MRKKLKYDVPVTLDSATWMSGSLDFIGSMFFNIPIAKTRKNLGTIKKNMLFMDVYFTKNWNTVMGFDPSPYC